MIQSFGNVELPTVALATATAAAVSTAAAATTAAAVSTAAAAAAASAGAGFALLGFVDAQGATFVVSPVQASDGRLGFRGVAHGDESETAAAARFPIDHDFGAVDLAKRSEE